MKQEKCYSSEGMKKKIIELMSLESTNVRCIYIQDNEIVIVLNK